MRLINRKKPINQHDDFYYLDYRWIGRCSLATGAMPQLVKNERKHEYLYNAPVTVCDSRNRLGNLLGVNIHTNFFVSDKLRSRMQDAQLSGLEYHPAQAHSNAKVRTESQNYWQLVVTGWGGQIAQQPTQWTEESHGARYRIYSGLNNHQPLLNASMPDVSDFFRVWPLPWITLVTRKAAMLLHECVGSDIDLTPLSEFKLPEICGKVVDVRVQPLTCYLPPKRGEAIGRPLGIDWW